jgi:hypothetical protein
MKIYTRVFHFKKSKFCSDRTKIKGALRVDLVFCLTTLVTSFTWLLLIVIDNENHREYAMAIDINPLISYCKSHKYLNLHVTDKFNKINKAEGSDKPTADVSVIETLLEVSIVLNSLAL